MEKIDDGDEMSGEDSTESHEATKFFAEVHVRFSEDIFYIYGVNVHEWELCKIADNCSANKFISTWM